jgi:uncharacterized protein (TIGR03085 family)
VSFSRSERHALCATLAEKGPDAPTLCEGWTTRDLAAHLVLREHRPDAAAGVLGGPIAPYTARVQRRIARQHDFDSLIAIIEHGPPRLSLFGIPGMDERANAVEFFVHHEDVRRGSPGWQPRSLDIETQSILWHRLGLARLVLRRAPCGVTLQWEGATATQPIIAKRGTPAVTVIGAPAELTIWVAGRKQAAQVRMDGDDDSVARLSKARWGL